MPSKSQAVDRPTLQLIEGGRRAEHEWTDEELRRLEMPSIKALPFVKLKKDAEPGWLPESFWHVVRTRDGDQDRARGSRYAVAAIQAMRADGCNVLSRILRDMIRSEVEREATARKEGRRRSRYDAVMAGFLDGLGVIFASCGNVLLAQELDRLIGNADFIKECMSNLSGKDRTGILKIQEDHIEKLRALQAGASDRQPRRLI